MGACWFRQHELWLFQEAEPLNRVCEQYGASYLVTAWANCLLELRGQDDSYPAVSEAVNGPPPPCKIGQNQKTKKH